MLELGKVELCGGPPKFWGWAKSILDVGQVSFELGSSKFSNLAKSTLWIVQVNFGMGQVGFEWGSTEFLNWLKSISAAAHPNLFLFWRCKSILGLGQVGF